MLESITQRHVFDIAIAAEQLTGQVVGEQIRATIEDGNLIIEVTYKPEQVPGHPDPADEQAPPARREGKTEATTTDDEPPFDGPYVSEGQANEDASPEDNDQEDEPKGGKLAQRAAMLCNEKAFQVFVEAGSPDEARQRILDKCEIGTRRLLDHDGAAAKIFRDMVSSYEAWLREG